MIQLLKIIQLEEASGPDARIELSTCLLREQLALIWEEGYEGGYDAAYLGGAPAFDDNPYKVSK